MMFLSKTNIMKQLKLQQSIPYNKNKLHNYLILCYTKIHNIIYIRIIFISP